MPASRDQRQDAQAMMTKRVKASLDDLGRAAPTSFFVQHEGKSKKNPHYIPAAKRKPASAAKRRRK
jgi:hypothetical protein